MKPAITKEIRQKFQDYKSNNLAWGSLHIILDDCNIQDHHVKFCLEYTKEGDDKEGIELLNILLLMSKTQRLKIANEIK